MSESDSVQQTWATVTDEPVALPSGEGVLLLGGTVRDDGPAEPRVEVRSVFGAIGPEVTGIELRLADGTTVTATVQAGLWAAWWPTTVSRADLQRLIVSTASGERVVEPDGRPADGLRSSGDGGERTSAPDRRTCLARATFKSRFVRADHYVMNTLACRAVAQAGLCAATASLDDEAEWPLLLVAGWLTTAADLMIEAGHLEAALALS